MRRFFGKLYVQVLIGVFAGVALDGAVLSMDDKANEAVYGRDTTPRMIFEDRAPQPPSAAIADFRSRLTEASANLSMAWQRGAISALQSTSMSPSTNIQSVRKPKSGWCTPSMSCTALEVTPIFLPTTFSPSFTRRARKSRLMA